MKFSETSTAKDYQLTVSDVDFEVTHNTFNFKPMVLIVPKNDEFPIETVYAKNGVHAHQIIAELKAN